MDKLAMIESSRKCYIPANTMRIADKHSDGIVYAYESPDHTGAIIPYAAGFHGRAAKPDFHIRFKSTERRQQHVKKFFRLRQEHAVLVAERREKQKRPHDLKVGDIMSGSWGYDQTNVDFVQVTRVIGARMIEIREVASRIDHSDDGPAEYVVPVVDSFTSEPKRKRVTDGYIKLSKWGRYCYKWDGNPCYETAFGWGH